MFRRRRRKKEPKALRHPKHTGGIAFALSFIGLVIFLRIVVPMLPSLWTGAASSYAVRFGVGFIFGICIAHAFIRGRSNVFIHELKHALVSGFAGNKWKGMKIGKASGHFSFSYTEKTAQYNAFILLAPYFLPLFTLPTTLFAGLIWYNKHEFAVIPAGIAFGIDLFMNIRDMRPHQTDLQVVTGGVRVAYLYLFLMNAAIASILFIWVLDGLFGYKLMFHQLGTSVLEFLDFYRSQKALPVSP